MSEKDNLINRDSLIKEIKNINTYDLVALKKVERAPAVDPVHAAGACYCRECKHFGHNLENDTYCSIINGLTDPEEYDFCSYGEPMEDAE